MEQDKKVCNNCWYLSDDFTSVCVNDKSPHCGDFVSKDGSCPLFDLDKKRVTDDE